MNGIVGKSVIIDALKPELGAKIVKAIIDDNERAKKRRAEKEAARKKAAKKRNQR